MAEDTQQPAEPQPERIEDLKIERELQDSYLTYAMSTIMDRALPDVRDGLKPSQRRILVAMNDLNLRPGSKHLKCAKIAGNTSGDYHPHGESVIYPTLVRLGQDWAMRYPLIDPQGNFGSTDGDPPAAMRYTEARPTRVEAELLEDLEFDTVDFQPNYDERLMEPTVLPGKFPNLLVNGSTGIAVGMACNLLPHNLGEICDAIVHVLNNPECELAELLQFVKGPDFPTGGKVMGIDGILDGYRTGRGKMTLRCKLHVEEDKKGRKSVVVDEMPYGVIRRSILEQIGAAVKNGHIEDVSAANDESGRKHKVRIVIDLKRDADENVVIEQLYRYTQCQVTVSMINIALVGRQPRTLGLKELITEFIAHRQNVITRRTKFLLRKAQQRGHILEGLIYAVVDIDEVVRLIRSSKTREEAIAKLRERQFRIPPEHPAAPTIPEELKARGPSALSQAQAEAIGRLQLIQLVGLEMEKLVAEYAEVVQQINEYRAILADVNLVYDIIREDIIEIKEKYADERRTEIDPTAYAAANLEDLIAPEEVVVTVSHNSYLKRLPINTYRSQGRGGRGIKGAGEKEGDFIEHLFVANTHDHLLYLTNKGRVYSTRVFDIPEMSRTSIGRSVANIVSLQPGKKVARVLAVEDFGKEESYLMFATRNGVVKKTALNAYGNIRVTGIIAINLDEDDELIGAEITSGTDQILLGTKKGMAIRFKEQDVRPMGRAAGGVKGVTLGKADEVVGMVVVPAGVGEALEAPEAAGDEDEPDNGGISGGVNGNGGETDDAGDSAEALAAGQGPWILVATENGFGKRTPVGEYRLIRRGGKGVKNIKMTSRNGDVVGMTVVHGGEDLMMITEKGILIRTRTGDISAYSRAAAGVRVIRVDDGDKLVALARIDAEDADVADVADAPEPEAEA